MFGDEEIEKSGPDIPEPEKEKNPEEQAREDLWSFLETQGCLQRVVDSDDRDRKNGSLFWSPGLSRNRLVSILEQHDAEEKLCREVLAYYGTYGFNPFQHIAINSRERIQILTGANSNGKSTLMRSIALALNTGMTGRKIQASNSDMSYCDGIYHDFEVHDDVQEGVSTFRAQVRNVLTFLKEATPYSLGLFDEMYHGTSSLYLLALAWSTVESMSQRNLRALVSTHEPLLTFCTREDGLELLRGIYANQRKITSGKVNGGIEGVCNISLRNHFELREGSVMDSDAFRVAREEKMPTKIIKRADHIKAILMGEA